MELTVLLRGNNAAAPPTMLRTDGECWAITDSAAGNQRQALALAERLQRPVRHIWCWNPGHPGHGSPHADLPGGRLALPADQRAMFAPPWPGLAIGCGRAAALFTRMLRTLSGGDCYTVQILDPRLDPRALGQRHRAPTRPAQRPQRDAPRSAR